MPAWTENDGRNAGGSASDAPARAWRRSTQCADEAECAGESNCVEAARLSPDRIGLRDSARPDLVLPLSNERFSALLQTIIDRAGR